MARRYVDATVTLSLAPGVTKRQALRELRTRCNELCCYDLDEADVRVRKAK